MIMAAGLGTRLRPLTYVMPKPMAPVLNVPVMEHIVRLLAGHGFGKVITNLSYMPEAIRSHFGDGSALGVELAYSEEPQPLGTAGGVGKAREFLAAADSFLVISGDALTDVDLAGLVAAHEANGGVATLATKRVSESSEFGVVITGDDGRVQGFQEKPDPAEALSDLANCGIYMFRREIFDYFPQPGHRSPAGGDDQPGGFVDWAMDVFPALLENDVAFHAHEIDADAYWNDIGTVAEFVQGNVDALEGVVALSAPGEQVADGIRAGEGSSFEGAELRAPIQIGAGCSIAPGATLHGPVVIGDGARIGAGAAVRGAVVLAGAELPAQAIAFGGVFGALPSSSG
jgi:mannose-1-phosphate guanylyltransferase